MLFFDLSGYVTRANKMAEELLDASEGALIGLKVDHFLPEHVRAVHDSYRERYLSDPLRLEIGHQTGIEIVTLGGRTFTGIVTLSLAHSPSGDAVVAIMRALDIDARQTDSRAQRLRDMA
jgi:PAS domain S-box-containing protein